MERSEQEKRLLEILVKESPRLDYVVTFHVSEEYGVEEFYVIPDEDKEKVLTELWPFVNCFKMTDLVYDIHKEDFFMFKDCMVMRWNHRNIIVCPDYLNTGGTCLDIIDIEKIKVNKIKED